MSCHQINDDDVVYNDNSDEDDDGNDDDVTYPPPIGQIDLHTIDGNVDWNLLLFASSDSKFKLEQQDTWQNSGFWLA